MICRILFIFLHIFSHFQNVTAFFGGRSFLFSRKARYSFEPSQRIAIADPPFIEDVLERYSHIKNTTNLALGSSYWKPPDAVSESLKSIFSDDSLYRYGNLMGLPMLISRLKCRLEKAGLKMDNQEMVITSGANQALSSVALTLCDPGDNAGSTGFSSFSSWFRLSFIALFVDIIFSFFLSKYYLRLSTSVINKIFS